MIISNIEHTVYHAAAAIAYQNPCVYPSHGRFGGAYVFIQTVIAIKKPEERYHRTIVAGRAMM